MSGTEVVKGDGWLHAGNALIRSVLHMDPDTLSDEAWGFQVRMAEWVENERADIRLPPDLPQVAPLVDVHGTFEALTQKVKQSGSHKDQEYPTCNSHSNTVSANIWIIAQITK